LSVHYSEDSLQPGTTSFVLTDMSTNKTQNITSGVPFNYAARLNETPGDKDLRVSVFFAMDEADATLNKTWNCGNEMWVYRPLLIVMFADILGKPSHICNGTCSYLPFLS